MKAKPLLLYAYILPYAGSLLVSILPVVLPFISYEDVASFYRSNVALCLALLAVAGGVSFPFQSKIIHEDNPHVLGVLNRGRVREVFRRASVFQAVTILLLSLLLIILSTMQANWKIVGLIELFASGQIIFESLALVSNGVSYGKIREKIIDTANKGSIVPAGSQTGQLHL